MKSEFDVYFMYDVLLYVFSEQVSISRNIRRYVDFNFMRHVDVSTHSKLLVEVHGKFKRFLSDLSV